MKPTHPVNRKKVLGLNLSSSDACHFQLWWLRKTYNHDVLIVEHTDCWNPDAENRHS